MLGMLIIPADNCNPQAVLFWDLIVNRELQHIKYAAICISQAVVFLDFTVNSILAGVLLIYASCACKTERFLKVGK